MADQKRWFKLWCSAPGDDDLQALSPATRWAWVAFGAYTKEHGNKGTVVVRSTNVVLAAQMGVSSDALFETIKMLPHMTIEEGQNRHGEITVTWHNWVKYQEDSTQAARARASRSKRRGEENKNENKNKDIDSAAPVPQKKKLDPIIKEVSDRIYASDPKRFNGLIKWIKSHMSTDDPRDIRACLLALEKRDREIGPIANWWGYLTGADAGYRLIDKMRTRRLERESQENKKAEVHPKYLHLAKGIGE